MEPVQLYRDLAQRPFQPRRVYLSDGRKFDVPCREMIVVGVDFVDIGLQTPQQPVGICAGIVTLSPQEIVNVEILSDAAKIGA